MDRHERETLPKWPTAAEWEPFLRRARPDDDEPVILDHRQIARIQLILGHAAAPEECADPEELAEQLRLLAAFFQTLDLETGSFADSYGGVPSADHWAALEQRPYYIAPQLHRRQVRKLQSMGVLDAKERPVEE